MSFRKLRGVRLPEEQQGLVRYLCLNHARQPKRVREKMERLCREAGGASSAALWEVMCTRKSITAIALAHHVSESALYRMRKEFYEKWFEKT